MAAIAADVIRIIRCIAADVPSQPFSRKKPAAMKVVDQSKPPEYAKAAKTGYLSRDAPAARAVRCLMPGIKYPITSPHLPE